MAAFDEDPNRRLQDAFLGYFETVTKRKDAGFVWDIINGPSADIQVVYKEMQKGLRSRMPANQKKRLELKP